MELAPTTKMPTRIAAATAIEASRPRRPSPGTRAAGHGRRQPARGGSRRHGRGHPPRVGQQAVEVRGPLAGARAGRRSASACAARRTAARPARSTRKTTNAGENMRRTATSSARSATSSSYTWCSSADSSSTLRSDVARSRTAASAGRSSTSRRDSTTRRSPRGRPRGGAPPAPSSTGRPCPPGPAPQNGIRKTSGSVRRSGRRGARRCRCGRPRSGPRTTVSKATVPPVSAVASRLGSAPRAQRQPAPARPVHQRLRFLPPLLAAPHRPHHERADEEQDRRQQGQADPVRAVVAQPDDRVDDEAHERQDRDVQPPRRSPARAHVRNVGTRPAGRTACRAPLDRYYLDIKIL